MAMTSWAIRRFLLQQPRGQLVKLSVRGTESEIKIGRGHSLSKVADSIYAVAPDVIELFAEDGSMLRACRPDVDLETSTEVPKVPATLSQDPETARLNHFATLLAAAYRHSTEVAFAKLVELCERIDARQDLLENRLERAEGGRLQALYRELEQARELAAREVEGADDGFETEMKRTIVGAWLQGRAEGRATTPPNGNGKGGG